MKTENMKYGTIILLMATILLGCTKESGLGGNEPPPEGSVRITLSNGNNAQQGQARTKAGESGEPPVNNDATSENYVKKIQVFFYDADNKLECIRQYVNGVTTDEIVWDGGTAMVVNRVSNLGKPKDIYVVTNWMADLPTEISVGSTQEVLQKQIADITELPFAPSSNTPILMSGAVKGYVFHESEGQEEGRIATIRLRRQMAKIEVKVLLDNTFYRTVSSNHTFGNAKLSVYNLPSQSFVIEPTTASLPTGSTMLELPNANIVNSSNTWDYTLYSHENPQTGILQGDMVKSTYFNLNVPYTKTVGNVTETHDNYYRVYIKDTGDTTNPHKTLRNHHYTVTVTLIGFGTEKPEFDAIHAVTTVTPWNSVDLEQEVSGMDISINKTSVMLSGNDVDSSLLVRGTTAFDRSLLTGLFSVTTYPTDPTMTTAQKNLKLGYTKIDDKSIKITIQDPADVPYNGDGITTFYIQYGAYKKKITVNYPLYHTIGYFGGDPKIPALAADGTMYPKWLAVAVAEDNKKYKNSLWFE